MVRRHIALVALTLTLVSACTGTSGDQTATTDDVATTPSTTIASDEPSGVGEPVATGPTIEWERVDAPEVFDGGALSGVVAAGPGLVAVGTDELDEDAAVWVSPDGTTWERIEAEAFSGEAGEDGLDGRQSMAAVTVGPAGIVAVGDYERRSERDVDPGVWISTDGRAWERIEDESFLLNGDDSLNSVTTWNGLYVAGGTVAGPVGSGESRPAIWLSEDGRDWELVEAAVFRVDASVHTVTRRGSRLYAAGSTGHVARPALWFSDDAESWDLILSDQSTDALIGSIGTDEVGDQSDMFMVDIAITPDGLVAVGGRAEPRRAVFWTSEDGMFWEIAAITGDYERPTIPVIMSSITTTAGGLIAVGRSPLDATRAPAISFAQVWVSVDAGTSWYQIERTDSSMAVDGPTSPWHIGSMIDIIPFDGGLLAVGFVPYQDVTLPGPFYHQAVWIGEWVDR